MARVISLKMNYQFMKNFSYLVVDPGSRMAVIVDPCWEMAKIEQVLVETQAELSGILVTHSHADHVHLVKPLPAQYRCTVWMSKEEISASGFEVRQLIGIH